MSVTKFTAKLLALLAPAVWLHSILKNTLMDEQDSVLSIAEKISRQLGEQGIVRVGSHLDTQTLYQAYLTGSFPWYNQHPILWWSPHQRAIITEQSLHISRSMRPLVNRCRLKNTNSQAIKITTDQDFYEVILNCRDEHQGSAEEHWLHDEMIDAYNQLHLEGQAHSFELWIGDRLAAGLYGVDCGSVFSAESMFSRHDNASKLLLIKVCQHLYSNGTTALDCQIPNPHTISLGAISIPRRQFIDLLNQPALPFTPLFIP